MGKKKSPEASQTLSMSESALDKVISMKMKSKPEPEPTPPDPKKMTTALQHVRDHPWYGFLSLIPVFMYGYFEYKGLALDLEEKQLVLEERRMELEEKSKEADKDRIEIDQDMQENLIDALERMDELEADMEFAWRILDSGLVRMIGGNTTIADEPPNTTHASSGGAMSTSRPPSKKSKRPSKTGSAKVKKGDYGFQKPKPAFK